MNKLAIFDLDGVLCDLKDVHFDALNAALVQCGQSPISRDDHLTRFDGLPTKSKLALLGIHGDLANKIDQIKQSETLKAIRLHIKPDPKLAMILHDCIAFSYLLAVISNARRETVGLCLELLSVEYLFSWVYTPDSVHASPKPSPEMHIALMKKANACPHTTVVFEDSPAGLRAAHESGALVAQVCGKLNRRDVADAIGRQRELYRYQWPDLNVVIPAAGHGRRFKDAGYDVPKPFIDVVGRHMIDRVAENLGLAGECLAIVPECGRFYNTSLRHIYIDRFTNGTTETCLEVEDIINGDRPLLIANSDQIIEWDHLAFHYFCQHTYLDAVVTTFDCPEKSPKWSYVELSPDGLVARIAEKDPISTTACCGVWFFKHGSEFVKYAKRLIAKNVRVNGEYYLSLVVGLMIADGKKVGTFKVNKFHSLGTPEDLQAYLSYRKDHRV